MTIIFYAISLLSLQNEKSYGLSMPNLCHMLLLIDLYQLTLWFSLIFSDTSMSIILFKIHM